MLAERVDAFLRVPAIFSRNLFLAGRLRAGCVPTSDIDYPPYMCAFRTSGREMDSCGLSARRPATITTPVTIARRLRCLVRRVGHTNFDEWDTARAVSQERETLSTKEAKVGSGNSEDRGFRPLLEYLLHEGR
jgi:hypothetical protein